MENKANSQNHGYIKSAEWYKLERINGMIMQNKADPHHRG